MPHASIANLVDERVRAQAGNYPNLNPDTTHLISHLTKLLIFNTQRTEATHTSESEESAPSAGSLLASALAPLAASQPRAVAAAPQAAHGSKAFPLCVPCSHRGARSQSAPLAGNAHKQSVAPGEEGHTMWTFIVSRLTRKCTSSGTGRPAELAAADDGGRAASAAARRDSSTMNSFSAAVTCGAAWPGGDMPQALGMLPASAVNQSSDPAFDRARASSM